MRGDKLAGLDFLVGGKKRLLLGPTVRVGAFGVSVVAWAKVSVSVTSESNCQVLFDCSLVSQFRYM